MTVPATVPHIARTSGQAGEPGHEQPGLLWVYPDLVGRMVPFVAPRVIFGRDGVGPTRLDGTEISRQHAEMYRQGLLSLLRDLGSTNGTYLNGQRVEEAPVLPGDVVRVGEWIGIVMNDVAGPLAAAGADSLFRTLAPGLYAGPTLAKVLAPLRESATANRRLPVVLEGDTGTGKECVSRAIHAWTGRRGPFAAINCAALPEAMAEAELFGHRAGAVPGSATAGIGHLRAADGGTLLLDEVVELPLAVQAKLLRALEQGEVTPLGETRPVAFDVQIVAASQVPLRQAVAGQRFRADLLARLDGMTVRLPPLRERIEEVPNLFARLLGAHLPDARTAVTPQLMEQLCLYEWPANVRELDLLVRRLSTLPDAERPLRPSSLPERIQAARRGPADAGEADRSTAPASAASEVDAPGTRDEALSLAVALKRSGGNVAKAAALLGISRQRAYRLIETSRDLDLASLRLEGDDPRLKSRARRG
jgi:two-component system response regulator FlrC